MIQSFHLWNINVMCKTAVFLVMYVQDIRPDSIVESLHNNTFNLPWIIMSYDNTLSNARFTRIL